MRSRVSLPYLVPVAAAAVLALPLGSEAHAQAASAEAPAMLEVAAASVAWSPLEVPGFDPGLQLAVLYGDPGQPDEPYTIRLRFPAGYEFPAHWHPRAENLTVLSGTFQLAMGTSGDPTSLKTYEPGDYLYIAPRKPHYGGVKGETVIQLHGVGPFDIELVE